jgi:copper chaperone CopZ
LISSHPFNVRINTPSNYKEDHLQNILGLVFKPDEFQIKEVAPDILLSLFSFEIDLFEVVTVLEEAGYRVINETLTVHLTGMTCIYCVSHVKGVFEELPGVIEVAVDLRNDLASVKTLPDKLTRNDFEKALEKSAYRVNNIT